MLGVKLLEHSYLALKGNAISYQSKEKPQLTVNSYPGFHKQYKLTDVQSQRSCTCKSK